MPYHLINCPNIYPLCSCFLCHAILSSCSFLFFSSAFNILSVLAIISAASSLMSINLLYSRRIVQKSYLPLPGGLTMFCVICLIELYRSHLIIPVVKVACSILIQVQPFRLRLYMLLLFLC